MLPAKMASAALDRFHETIPISTLESFAFHVFDPETGLVLEENPEHVGYSASDLARDCVRVVMYPPEPYSVAVEAVDDQGHARTLGKVTVAALHSEGAKLKALQNLWAPDLTARGLQPRFQVQCLA